MSSILLAASTGCRTATDNQIDLLERELRVQEDYIYELEDYVVEYSEKLRDLRCEFPQQTAVYAEEIVLPEGDAPLYEPESSSAAGSAAKPAESKPRARKKRPPAKPQPKTPDFSPEEMEIPDDIEIDIEDPVSQTQQDNTTQVSYVEQPFEEPQAAALNIPDPRDYVVDDPVVEARYEQDTEPSDEQSFEELFADDQVETTAAETILEADIDRTAVRLEIVQIFEGQGDQLSPKNLLTVIEALDARGEPVDLNGEVSVMIMTPDLTAPHRIKRWDFTPEETFASWQSSELGDGLHLELPLEKTALPNTALELWVRFVNADGDKLLTQLPFEPSKLGDIADATPPESSSPSNGLTLVEPEQLAQTEPKQSELEVAQKEPPSINPLRIKTASLPEVEKPEQYKTSTSQTQTLKLVENKEPINQPRWRAASKHSNSKTTNFATTNKTKGWQRQSLASRQSAPPRIPASSKAAQPVWTSGRVTATK